MKLLGHKGIVRSVCFSKDENILFSAGTIDFHIKIWDINKGSVIRTLEGHTDHIYSVQVNYLIILFIIY